MTIVTERLEVEKRHFGITALLSGEIDGATTHRVSVEKGTEYTLPAHEDQARVVFIINGSGSFQADDDEIRSFSGMALYALAPDSALRVQAGQKNVVCLEVIVSLSVAEVEQFGRKPHPTRYFLRYSDAPCYREDIKSPKTVSRTLLPAGLVPRLAIGSVETVGPDQVLPHRHPMLEQLFYSLPGNNCQVQADGTKVSFGEHTLLHIPPGSNHGVSVNEGNLLHYLWMDFFKDSESMAYLEEAHRLIDE